jgi:hypothetical protein
MKHPPKNFSTRKRSSVFWFEKRLHRVERLQNGQGTAVDFHCFVFLIGSATGPMQTAIKHDAWGALDLAVYLSKYFSDAINSVSSASAFGGGYVTSTFGDTHVLEQSSTSAFGKSTFRKAKPSVGTATVSEEGFNWAATEAEAERLLYFIQCKEKDLEAMSKELSNEQKLLKPCELAISDHTRCTLMTSW